MSAPLIAGSLGFGARPSQDVEAGQWIRAVGSDIAGGAVVLAAGERLGAAEIGILATVGAATVQVSTASSLLPRSAVNSCRARH